MGDTGQYRCHRPLEEMRREAPGCAALGLAAEPTLGFLPAGDEGGETPWGGGLGCTPPAPSSSLCPPGGCWGRSTVEQPCPAPTVAQLGPLRTPQCNGGPHPSAPQVSAEPCSSGGSSSECWARRKCPSEGERSSSTMFTHLSVPGSPLLSWTPIFVGTGGASRFSERPCKVENKTAETPLAWTRYPGAAQTQLRVPLLFPCCDKVAWGSCSDPTPPGRAANNNSEGLTCGPGWGGGSSRAGGWQQPPRRWAGSP